MAFSAITARGGTQAQSAATSVAASPSANLTAGKLVIVTVHCDNTATADGASSTITNVSDNASGSQNVWRKATERTETDGAANDGSVVAVWYSILATQIGTSDTITATLSASLTARAITFTEATITGDWVTVEDVGVGQNSITAASGTVSNKEHLFFYAASSEGNDNSKTATTNYTEAHDNRTGNTGDVNISFYVQTRIQTATSSGSVAPSAWATNLTNPISVLVTFSENILRAVPVGSVAVTGLAGSLALALGMSVGSIGLTGPYLGVAFEGPTVGSLDLTGLAPTVSVAESGVTRDPGAGSLDLTGRAPSLAFAYAVPAGTLDLTGLTATPYIGQFVAPGVGSVDLTGLAPTPLANLDRAPGVGSIDLTGVAPSMAFVHPIPVGTLDLAGRAPALDITTLATPGVGALDLTGHAPAVAFTYAVPAGTLDLAGLTPGVFAGQLITAGVGSVDLTGLASALNVGLSVPAGTLDLSGLAPVTLNDKPATPGVGSISLTGHAPALAFTVAVPAGALDLTELAPSLGGSVTLTPPAGTIDLSGLAPLIAVGQFAHPGVGAIDLTGHAPALAFTVAVPAGSISLTGYAPTMDATGDPVVLTLRGHYQTTITLRGHYQTTVTLRGTYLPTITLRGHTDEET